MKTILGFRPDFDDAVLDEGAERTSAFVEFYRSLGVALARTL